VTVCHGTSAVPARFRRVGERFAQLRLERPLVVAPGDHIVLRQETTAGGGRVIDSAPPRRLDAERLDRIELGELASLVDGPVAVAALARRFQLDDAELAAALNGVIRAGGYVLSPSWLADTREKAASALAARGGELDPGLPLSALLPSAPWAADVAPLLELDEHEGKLYLPGRRPSSGGRAVSAEPGGLEPFAVEDAALARQLEREGRLVVLGGGLALSPHAYEHLETISDRCEDVANVIEGIVLENS